MLRPAVELHPESPLSGVQVIGGDEVAIAHEATGLELESLEGAGGDEASDLLAAYAQEVGRICDVDPGIGRQFAGVVAYLDDAVGVDLPFLPRHKA